MLHSSFGADGPAFEAVFPIVTGSFLPGSGCKRIQYTDGQMLGQMPANPTQM